MRNTKHYFSVGRQCTDNYAESSRVLLPVYTGSGCFGNYMAEGLDRPGIPVTLINMALNLITEFLYDKYIVFKDSIENDLAKKELNRETKGDYE